MKRTVKFSSLECGALFVLKSNVTGCVAHLYKKADFENAYLLGYLDPHTLEPVREVTGLVEGVSHVDPKKDVIVGGGWEQADGEV